jgi:hypothetical protein
VLLFLLACSSPPGAAVHLQAGPYNAHDVVRAVGIVGNVFAGEWPSFERDFYGHGFSLEIREDVVDECEMHQGNAGCTVPETGEMWLAPGDGECLASTALAHELTHMLVYLYELPGNEDHSTPGIWSARGLSARATAALSTACQYGDL